MELFGFHLYVMQTMTAQAIKHKKRYKCNLKSFASLCLEEKIAFLITFTLDLVPPWKIASFGVCATVPHPFKSQPKQLNMNTPGG